LTRLQQLIALNTCFFVGKVIQLSLLATTSWSLSLLPLLFAVAVSLVFYRLGDRLAGQYPEAAFRRLLGMFLSLMAAFLVVRATIGT
jgi:uncharacterized membrane protein YfcA